ncbi:hypothetical protein ACQEWB_30525 [Streptomyces sp. CA-249302]|uniref:hypothetical protein n=1 Tax=Streptomyces sp. CA-249302 TaxID=3240058 RepID=UPI003D90E4CA
MRRWVCCAVLLGVVAGLGAAAPASADEKCGGDFPAKLNCWADQLDKRSTAVLLDHQLKLDGSQGDRDEAIELAKDHRGNLEVQVPAGVSTGEGGTMLLVLAGHRLVDPDARIDRLSPKLIQVLTDHDLCAGRDGDLCKLVGKPNVTGEKLIHAKLATPQSTYVANSTGDNSDRDKWLLFATATALVLLLAAFVLVVRRTRTAPAVSAPAATRTADEPTRALRPTPAPARRVGPTHPATVRTPLHPQGYVELDRVLYRAVWAEPAEPPPAPGSRVDVADPPDAGSDVLYAYPPAPARHARAH